MKTVGRCVVGLGIAWGAIAAWAEERTQPFSAAVPKMDGSEARGNLP